MTVGASSAETELVDNMERLIANRDDREHGDVEALVEFPGAQIALETATAFTLLAPEISLPFIYASVNQVHEFGTVLRAKFGDENVRSFPNPLPIRFPTVVIFEIERTEEEEEEL